MFSGGSFVLRVLIPGLSETASGWTLCHGGPSYPYHSHMVLRGTTLAPDLNVLTLMDISYMMMAGSCILPYNCNIKCDTCVSGISNIIL